jgi:hypothetical protein
MEIPFISIREIGLVAAVIVTFWLPRVNRVLAQCIQSVMNQDKRLLRSLKRKVKRTGNKRRRQFLKKDLSERPEEAPYSEFEFGRNSSQAMNGIDQDATRQR